MIYACNPEGGHPAEQLVALIVVSELPFDRYARPCYACAADRGGKLGSVASF